MQNKHIICFLLAVVLFSPSVATCGEEPGSASSSVISGIICDADGFQAVIGTQMYGAGDSLCSGRVAMIDHQSVKVDFGYAQRIFHIGEEVCSAHLNQVVLERDSQTRAAVVYIISEIKELKSLEPCFHPGMLNKITRQSWEENVRGIDSSARKIKNYPFPGKSGIFPLLALKMLRLLRQGWIFAGQEDEKHSRLYFSRAQRLYEEMSRLAQDALENSQQSNNK